MFIFIRRHLKMTSEDRGRRRQPLEPSQEENCLIIKFLVGFPSGRVLSFKIWCGKILKQQEVRSKLDSSYGELLPSGASDLPQTLSKVR